VSATESEPATARTASAFGIIYSGNVTAVEAFFARRCTEPQTVADLVSETFVEAVASFATFDPRRGSPRGWLYGIARRVFARWCAGVSGERLMAERLRGRIVLDADETDELAGRIDAQQEGRALLERCASLPELERAALELVDLAGLSPKEAARTLDVSAGALRVRLHRARARLRNGG
jgi:RNA polymerase sigma factor (sigma-70 family)